MKKNCLVDSLAHFRSFGTVLLVWHSVNIHAICTFLRFQDVFFSVIVFHSSIALLLHPIALYGVFRVFASHFECHFDSVLYIVEMHNKLH